MKPFLYERLTQALLAELASGMYAEGQRWLSLRKIQRLWAVSELTARKALRNLVAENLLEAQPQRGFVLCPGFQRAALLLLHKSKRAGLPPPVTWESKRRHLLQDKTSANFRFGVILEERRGGAPETPDPADLLAARAFFQSATHAGCEIEFLYKGTSLEREDLILNRVESEQIDAVVLVRRSRVQVLRPFIEKIMRLGIPVLTVFDDCEQTATASINFNNIGAGYAAGRILLNHGHTRIVILLAHRFIANFEQRIEGMRMIFEERELDPDTALSICRLPGKGDFTKVVRNAFVNSPSPPTALFCPGINLYVNIRPILASLGISTPGNLSVIGTGNRELLPRNERKLDLLKLDFSAAGHLAFQQMNTFLKGGTLKKALLIRTPYEPIGSVQRASSVTPTPPIKRVSRLRKKIRK